MDAPDHYQTTYDSKTKIVVFYSLIQGLSISLMAAIRYEYIILLHRHLTIDYDMA